MEIYVEWTAHRTSEWIPTSIAEQNKWEKNEIFYHIFIILKFIPISLFPSFFSLSHSIYLFAGKVGHTW